MEHIKTKSLRLFNYKNLPLKHFCEVSETNNYRYLYNVPFDEVDDVEIDKESFKMLENAWLEITEQLRPYIDKVKDDMSSIRLIKETSKYIEEISALNSLLTFVSEKNIDLLNTRGYNIFRDPHGCKDEDRDPFGLEKYEISLEKAQQRIHWRVGNIQSLKMQVDGSKLCPSCSGEGCDRCDGGFIKKKEDKEDGLYDSLMAWLVQNNVVIQEDEKNPTVIRFFKIKKNIDATITAKQAS